MTLTRVFALLVLVFCSGLTSAATPELGAPHEGGLFLFREPVEIYWNDWVAYPQGDRAATRAQPQVTIKSEGKTSSFDGVLTINCATGKFDWKEVKNFSVAVPREADVRKIVPVEVVKNATRLFCGSQRSSVSDISTTDTIDTCLNNVLYCGPEVHHEAHRKPRGTGTSARASAGAAQGRTAAR